MSVFGVWFLLIATEECIALDVLHVLKPMKKFEVSSASFEYVLKEHFPVLEKEVVVFSFHSFLWEMHVAYCDCELKGFTYFV